MIQFIKGLFIKDTTPSIEEMIKSGGIIIDVRTTAEFNSGHLSKSTNIPLDQLKKNLNRFDKRKPIVTCCASGMRSGSAKKIFKSNGFETVRNGGGWSSLKKYDF